MTGLLAARVPGCDAVEPREGAAPSGYIASNAYDIAFFILAPAIALAISLAVAPATWPFELTRALGFVDARIVIFLGVWNAAHLAAVVFRSHANPVIFARHRARFVFAPPALFLAFLSSDWLLAVGFVIAALWDVYHSGMQTFGLGRIYDARLGNPPETGRRLDFWLNHVIYAGPILGGLSLITTLDDLHLFTPLGWDLPVRMLGVIESSQDWIRAAVIATGTLFLLYYVYAYRRLAATGYRVSSQKVALLVATASTSIYAWGFLPPLQAFFVANFFHPLQYFALLWCTEQRNLRGLLRLSRIGSGRALTLIGFLCSLVVLGCCYAAGERSDLRWGLSAVLVVSLMHFWYDGFIWSVRRREVG